MYLCSNTFQDENQRQSSHSLKTSARYEVLQSEQHALDNPDTVHLISQ